VLKIIVVDKPVGQNNTISIAMTQNHHRDNFVPKNNYSKQTQNISRRKFGGPPYILQYLSKPLEILLLPTHRNKTIIPCAKFEFSPFVSTLNGLKNHYRDSNVERFPSSSFNKKTKKIFQQIQLEILF